MKDYPIKNKWLGCIAYSDALGLQDGLKKEAHQTAVLLGLEHAPVITLGKRASREEDIVGLREGFEILPSERGGQATLHSPGQLVIYPVLSLKKLGVGVKDFVGLCLQVTAELCKENGVETRQICGEPGLYTEKGKIAFIGIRVSQGIVTHGLSLNVHNDLSEFEQIRSCGVQSQALDRLASSGDEMPLNQLFSRWVELFNRRTS